MQEPLFDLSRHRVCVILNPGSGSKDDRAVARAIEDALKPRCAGFALRQTARGSDIVAVARGAVAEGFEVIVAAGGDGTQSAVAGALAGTDAIMGVLPGGTFNYFARGLGVGEEIPEALDSIGHARVARVDIGQIENLVFLNNVSLGAYPHILKTRESIYRRWGRSRLAAYWSVLVALRRLRRPMTLTATVNGESRDYTTALVFVARSAYQLDSFGLDGADAIRDGKFAVLIAKARQPLPLLRSAFRLAFGFSAKDSDFDMIVTDDLTIVTPRKRMLIAHDGEKTMMASPLHLKVWHGGLRVLLPAEAPAETKDRAA
ncbi:diacylglycerol/lipid kinase family protein [Paracoccus spongiarum]|uniref:Diacylglycerol kinase family protein n=1 Tax=Paracoccus spongiarum TaxID=3064387 RepID=A0ABT9J7G4_9RHOB|nr:diacylglycerol kinase family protein [Paracoccus sp. 2205BS29-5]MDP5305748.1 diacylglycerol kinase family protein [Paracoccus sp. 2205BS29-5]